MHDSLLSICSNIHVTTPSVTSEKFYNWHQVSSHDLVYFYFSPIHPYSLSPTLSYLINNFYFFSNIKNLTPKLELSSSLLLTETQIAISNVNYRLARLFTIHYKSLLDKKVSCALYRVELHVLQVYMYINSQLRNRFKPLLPWETLPCYNCHLSTCIWAFLMIYPLQTLPLPTFKYFIPTNQTFQFLLVSTRTIRGD